MSVSSALGALVRATSVTLFLGCTAAPAVAQDAAPPTAETIAVDRAVDEAIEHNLELLARRVDLSVAEARQITAGLRPNPVFSFDADHLDWLGTRFNGINNGGPREIGWRVDVPVERGSKRALRVAEAAIDRSLAEARLEEAIRMLRQDVEHACADAVQAADNLAVARDTLKTFEGLARLNDDRVRAGAAAGYEATRTRVALLQYKSTVSRAELDQRAASVRLRQLLGRTPSADPLVVLAALPIVEDRAVPQRSSLEALALAHRPDVRVAREAEARSTSELRLQVALGKVDFTWGAEFRRQAGPIGLSNSLGLFFSAPLPLFNRNQGEIARAGAERLQASRTIASAEALARAEVQSAFEEFVNARALVTSIERDLLQPAQAVRETVAYTYRAGASTLVELLDSQRAWNDTIQSYHQAQADYRRAISHLNAAVGTQVIR